MKKLLIGVFIVLFASVAQAAFMVNSYQYTPVGDSALYTDANAVWRFNNNLDDEKGTHDGTGSGNPTYSTTSPQEGTHYVEFDSTGDYVTVSDHTDFDVEDADASFATRIRLETNDGKLSVGNYGGGDGWRIRIIYDAGGPNIAFDFDNGWGGGLYQTIVTNASLSTWYHIGWTYDHSETTAEVTVWVSTSTFGDVVNGTTYNASSSIGDTTNDIIFGEDGMECDFDESVFWDSEISATDMQNVFENPGSW